MRSSNFRTLITLRVYLLSGALMIMAGSLFAASSIYTFTLNSIDGKPAPLALASEGQKPSTDSPMESLLTACATDFHVHRPPDVTRFRDVRFGHVMTSAGAKQYLLCGEFLPAQREGKAEWTPFVTIKTSGYEHWLGGQAASWCQRSQVVWDNDGDLSSSLQKRLDSLQ